MFSSGRLAPSRPLWVLLLLVLFASSGCSSLPKAGIGETQAAAGAEDPLESRLRTLDCRTAFDVLEQGEYPPGLRLEVAQRCLQTGQFTQVQHIAAATLSDAPQHPDADYAAYLHALAGFGLWSNLPPRQPVARVEAGRHTFQEIVAFLRHYPLSPYGDTLAPRLVRLREGIAEAELHLAEQAFRNGQAALAQARAEYVIRAYPRTQAAADAARWLIRWAPSQEGERP